mmetsp:Transcript_9532/g.18490  ORF Transcript_9532/g.18490 Transcript_9532/m.18490 type:complete len:301 (+) Transcript_9532:7812-8714(+)
MSGNHRQTLKQLVKTPSAKFSSKDLLEFLSSRSATTLHKTSTHPKETDNFMPKTQDAIDSYFKLRASTKSGDSKPASKKKRTGSNTLNVKAFLHDHFAMKDDLTKMNSQGLTRTYEDDKHEALDQVQEKLLATIGQVAEMKRELKSYDRFFSELYDFFAASETNDLVAIGLSKMRHFYKLRKFKPDSAKPSKPGTPEPKHFEFKTKSKGKPKSDRKRLSPSSSSKTARNLPSRMSRVVSAHGNSAQTPSLRMFSSSRHSRCSTPLDQLESTADKLEFIKLKTFEVLQSWERESASRGKKC